MVERAEDYEYSSARFHCGLEENRDWGHGGLLSGTSRFPGPIGHRRWSQWLREGLDEVTLQRLRKNTMTGQPIGQRRFHQPN